MIEKVKESKNNQNNQTFFQTAPSLWNGYTIEPFLPPQGAGQISETLMLSTASASRAKKRKTKQGIAPLGQEGQKQRGSSGRSYAERRVTTTVEHLRSANRYSVKVAGSEHRNLKTGQFFKRNRFFSNEIKRATHDRPC